MVGACALSRGFWRRRGAAPVRCESGAPRPTALSSSYFCLPASSTSTVKSTLLVVSTFTYFFNIGFLFDIFFIVLCTSCEESGR